MWGIGAQEGEVEGCDGDDKEMNNGYECHCEGGAGGRAGR